MLAEVMAVVVVGVGVVVMVASKDDGSSAERGAYVDAVASIGEAHGVHPESSSCFSEATVDAVGLDALQDVATPDDLRDNPDRTPRSWGISLDGGRAEVFYDQVQDCIDTRQVYMDRLREDGLLTPEALACVDQALGDDILRRYFVTLWLDLENPLDADAELRRDFVAAVAHCPPFGA